MKNFWNDFKKFISRGNIVDMAVGVIIGSAFSTIVTSLTNKIIMPLINMLLSLGGNGLDSAYSFLKIVRATDGTIDYTKSIYIDWGAFITAVINFFLIALVLFTILRVMMKSRKFLEEAQTKSQKRRFTKEQKALLVSRGIDPKDKVAGRAELEKIAAEEKAKAEEEAKANYKPSDNELLAEIRDLLKNKENK